MLVDPSFEGLVVCRGTGVERGGFGKLGSRSEVDTTIELATMGRESRDGGGFVKDVEDIMKFQKMDILSAGTDFDVIRLASSKIS